MDQEIEEMIKECRGCQLAAKAPPIKTQLWPKTQIPWTHMHIDYAEQLKGYHNLIIINSFSKRPEIYKFKYPTSINTIKALDEILSCFRVPEIVVNVFV